MTRLRMISIGFVASAVLWACMPSSSGGGGDDDDAGSGGVSAAGGMAAAGGATGAGGGPGDGGMSAGGNAATGGTSGTGGLAGTGGMAATGGVAGGGGAAPVGGTAGGDGGSAGDPCEAVDCGEFGDCRGGECVCREGFEGEDCSIPPLPMGDTVAMCQAFIRCTEACDSERCRERCVQSERGGAAVYIRMTACADRNDCWSAGSLDPECVSGACGAEVDACFGAAGQPSGDLTCMLSLACRVECEGDAACIQACVTESNPASHALLERALVCAGENGCFTAEGLDVDCAYDRCDGEWRACREDSQGDWFCGQIFACVSECEDIDCVEGCYYQGNTQSQDLFSLWLDCVQNSDCENPFECEECAPLENACFADGM